MYPATLSTAIRSDNVLNASQHFLRGNSDPSRAARAVRRRQTRRATAIQWSSAVVQGSLAWP